MKYQGFSWKVKYVEFLSALEEVVIGRERHSVINNFFCDYLGALDRYFGPRAIRAAAILGPQNLHQLKLAINGCNNIIKELWNSGAADFIFFDFGVFDGHASNEMRYFSESGKAVFIIREPCTKNEEFIFFLGRTEKVSKDDLASRCSNLLSPKRTLTFQVVEADHYYSS